MRPTNGSEIVKDLSNSLDGAWREDSFWRAMRITVLPRVVVTDKTINVDYYERYQFISLVLPPLENFGKQYSSSNVVYPSPLREDEWLNCAMISTDIQYPSKWV